MAEEYTQLRVLRLFGLESDVVTPVLRRAAHQGCPGLQLGEKDGEYAVCIQAAAPSPLKAAQVCEAWEKSLRTAFGPAIYGVDAIDLPHAAVAALLVTQKLMVAVDQPTGFILEKMLRPVEEAVGVYDFGGQSYAHPKKAERLDDLPGWALRNDNPVARAAGRAQQALRISGADYAVALIPSSSEGPAAAMLCTAREGWVRALPARATVGLAANWLLELARRAASMLPMPSTVQSFRIGSEVPEPVLPVQAPVPPAAPGVPEEPAQEPEEQEALPVQEEAAPEEEPAQSEPAAEPETAAEEPAEPEEAESPAEEPALPAEPEEPAEAPAEPETPEEPAAPEAPVKPAAPVAPRAPQEPKAPRAPRNTPAQAVQAACGEEHREDGKKPAKPHKNGSMRILVGILVVLIVVLVMMLFTGPGKDGDAAGSAQGARQTYSAQNGAFDLDRLPGVEPLAL